MDERKQRHVSLAERLQDKLLEAYLDKLESGDLSDTGMAALQKLLIQMGWDFDPTNLPQELRDHLTTHLDPNELDDDDADVLDIRKHMTG